MMKTIDGKSYSVVVTDFRESFTLAAATIDSPLIVLKNVNNPVVSGFGFMPPWNVTPPLIVNCDQPIIPLSLSVAVIQATGIPSIPFYAFKTCFIVNIPAPLLVGSGYVFSTGLNSKYSSKIAPYARINETGLKAPNGVNQPKQWYGDIALQNWDKIPFHSGDFIYPNPSYFVPTDTAYWYQNYINAATPAATAPSSQTSGLSNYQLPAGTYSRTAVFQYLILN